MESNQIVVVAAKAQAQQIRNILTSKGMYDTERKINRADDQNELEIPIKVNDEHGDLKFLQDILQGFTFELRESNRVELDKSSINAELVQHCKQV